jgi:competence protein ComGC
MPSDNPEQSELAKPGPKPKGRILKVLLYVPLLIVLIAVAIPNFVRAKATTCKNACVNILRQIDGAKAQYALESKSEKGAVVTADQISPFLKGGKVEKCPGDGIILVGLVGENPTCSIPEHNFLKK